MSSWERGRSTGVDRGRIGYRPVHGVRNRLILCWPGCRSILLLEAPLPSLFEPVVYNKDLGRQSHDLGFKLYSPASDSEINLATCLPELKTENRILPLS